MWKPVRLDGWNTARIARMIHDVHFQEDKAMLTLITHRETTSESWNYSCGATLQTHDGRDVRSMESTFKGAWSETKFQVEQPKLWWPQGHGPQWLYKLRYEIYEDERSVKHGQLTDFREQQIGLRTVELDTTPDSIGSKFVLK